MDARETPKKCLRTPKCCTGSFFLLTISAKRSHSIMFHVGFLHREKAGDRQKRDEWLKKKKKNQEPSVGTKHIFDPA